MEVGAFVSPKWLPQMADSDDLFRRIDRNPAVTYSALVPNERGLERAVAAGVDKIALFTAASETFNRKNINASISESIDRFLPVVAHARKDGLPLRGYISTVFFCPYEGQMPSDACLPVVRKLTELGVEEICLADTVGHASADDVRRVLDLVVRECPANRLALHFHNTYRRAVANALVGWREYGILEHDAAAGGLGGCPYAEGARGNVATEELVEAFRANGADVPVDIDRVRDAVRLLPRKP